MKKLDLKKYDVGWEYLDYDFKSLIGVCIIMPGFTFMIVDTFISIFSPFFDCSGFIISYFIVNLSVLFSFVSNYIDGYHRQLKSKTEKCKKCSFFTYVEKDCTFEGIELEDGRVDYTLPYELVKSNKCKDCECYIPEAFNGLEACTYVGKFKEDGSVDFTRPCENKSIDKQLSR